MEDKEVEMITKYVKLECCVRNAVGKLLRQEEGMATVEYAILIVAAAGFAGLVAMLLKSDWVKDQLRTMIESALTQE
ncbi:MAG: DUF4244 domain-containing protein [Candidatus Ancillula sp.]|nr:DUF4244 domain-containing protein [Candidatus Ancillula sp.]